MDLFEIKDGELLLSTNKGLLNMDLIHSYLTQSYWSLGISKELVSKAVQNSLAVGLFKSGKQIGFCRLITDYSTFAYLADVFISEEEKGKSYGQFLMINIRKHPMLQSLRRWLLATKDAHLLYKKSGWQLLEKPEYFMEIVQEDPYK